MSSFTYYSSIPQANDVISQSQPQILQNFGSINNIINVDHYTFQSSGSKDGYHKQVTFAGNNVASLPATFPVLFSNTQDGAGNNLPGSVAQVFAYSGDTGPGGGNGQNYIALSSGSSMLFGGLIIKWARPSWPGQGGTITFASAFPNNCFSVVACNAYSGNLNATINITSFSSTGFVVNCPQNQSPNFSYIAIGN